MPKLLFLFVPLVLLITIGVIFFTRPTALTTIVDNVTLTETVSTSVPTAPPTPTPPPGFSLIFVGDMMFDRNIRIKSATLGGYDKLLDQPLIDLLHSADLVVGNLEGPITENPSTSVGSVPGSPANFIFTFDPAVVPALKAFNILVVNLGNNHILNQGQAGERLTKQFLSSGGITFFGDTGAIPPPSSTSTVVEVNGSRVGLVNYNQFTNGSFERALEELEAIQDKSDIQVVYTHWGNEYVPENQVLKNQARAFVQAGADMVIGTHPHVITGNEIIDGAPIYYSLGNFIFDQYFEPAVMEGLVVKATINTKTGEVATAEYHVDIGKDGVTRLRQ